MARLSLLALLLAAAAALTAGQASGGGLMSAGLSLLTGGGGGLAGNGMVAQGLDVMQQGLELLQGMSAVAPLSSIPENMLSSFVDLSRLDGPQIGVFQRLFEMMQNELLDGFGVLTPSDVSSKAKIKMVSKGVSEAWADALLKFQFNSGLEAFLDYFPGTRAIDDGMDERLVRAICTLHPWNHPKEASRAFKDAYCPRAIHAVIQEKHERKRQEIEEDKERKRDEIEQRKREKEMEKFERDVARRMGKP